MKIAIDARKIFNLILQLINQNYNNELILFSDKGLNHLPEFTDKAKIRVLGWPRSPILWTLLRLPLSLFAKSVDLLFMPVQYVPYFCPTKVVCTVHDLAFITHPSYFKPLKRILYSKMTTYSVKKACRIIAVSQSTKNDLVKYYRIKPEKITVICHGYNRDLFKEKFSLEVIKKTKDKYGLADKNYILYVGELQPRKNITTLIKAFNSVKDSITKYHLVIVGRKGWYYEDIFKHVENYKLHDRIIFTGYVPEKDLPVLMNQAKVFVYPSLYEGFGLPVIEAMACGAPVITSNVSSLPEVAGDAAILVDPYNVDDIANAIYNVINDKELRESLIYKGLKRAKEFSWEKAAKETLEVFEEVYNETKLIGKG
ncbi:MAG: Glycosyl transferase group 1 [Parcubacteria group bacterium GW2011_GWC2_38_7]|nr:MAG: Glycosyl transferase group 1 [Parcubacteria group bacterium GW2011_GWC2_38_7]